MRNPFVAAAIAASALARMARSAAAYASNLGLKPRDAVEHISGADNIGHNKHSRNTTAREQRAARKARNRIRNRLAHRGAKR